jgi:hypothetical protein
MLAGKNSDRERPLLTALKAEMIMISAAPWMSAA